MDLDDFDPDAHNERLRETGSMEAFDEAEREHLIDALGYGPPPGF